MTRLPTVIILCLGTSLLLSGCTGVSRLREELATREMAKSSYASNYHGTATCQESRHFERGWRQAYYNVSKGADPCPPSVPPEVYWSTKYQNPEGCGKIAAWYEGYRAGATVAKSECRDAYSKVPVMARCVREEVPCEPVQPLRDGSVEQHLVATGSAGEIDHEYLATEEIESQQQTHARAGGIIHSEVSATAYPPATRLPFVE